MDDSQDHAGSARASILIRLGLFAASLACAALSGLAMTFVARESPAPSATHAAAPPAAAVAPAVAMRPAIPAAPPNTEPPAKPAHPPAPIPPAPEPPPPQPSPAGLRPGAAPAPTRDVPPAPAQPARQAGLTLPAGGAYVAQVGAFPSIALAQQSWTALAASHPGLARLSPQVKPVNLNGRIVYRSQLEGFATKAGALSFCRTLRAAGDDCFVPVEGDSGAPNESTRQ